MTMEDHTKKNKYNDRQEKWCVCVLKIKLITKVNMKLHSLCIASSNDAVSTFNWVAATQCIPHEPHEFQRVLATLFFNTQTPRYGRRTRLHRLKSLADKLINGDTNNCVRTWNQRQQQKTKQQIWRLIRKTKTNQRMDEACECDLVRPSATHCFSSIIIIIIKNGTISHTFSEFKLHLDQKKAVCRFVLFFSSLSYSNRTCISWTN